jgi:hypothetical protein
MLALTVEAKVNENGIVTLKVPPQVAPGYHKMVLVIEETALAEVTEGMQDDALSEPERKFRLPAHDVGPWPENLSLRREDLYDDWGR